MQALLNRLYALEGRFERLRASVDELTRKVTQALQRIRELQQTPSGGGAPTPTVALWCKTPGSVAAATGSFPTLTASSFTADIYKDAGGTLTLVASSATVRWWYKDTAAASKLVPVLPNGDGTYNALAESCTAV
jgi:hypothetical protein